MAPRLGHAARLLRESSTGVALTGAGVSTRSGVPDFRSASGLWREYDPLEVASQDAFRHHPERFFEWVRPLAAAILRAEPNPAHYSLARLERARRLAGIVTQNIDGLHARAGSSRVCEIHGDLRRATCVRCFRGVEAAAPIRAFVDSGATPRCEACGGVLKPDVVLFGEALPRAAVHLAEALFANADLVLIAGSSLEVYPAAAFPLPAVRAGARLIIVNQEPTCLDDQADVVLTGDVAEILPALADEVLGARS